MRTTAITANALGRSQFCALSRTRTYAIKSKTTEDAIEAYQQVNLEFQKTVRNPRLAVRDSDLVDIEKTLAAFDEKVKNWPDTRLAKRHQEWTADASARLQSRVSICTGYRVRDDSDRGGP